MAGKKDLMLDYIKSRRAVREYLEKEPTDKAIEKILDAGRWAPSGLNNQPWRFVVIKDKDVKEDISRLTKYSKIVRSAPVLICVFLDNQEVYNRDKDMLSAGACIQNMILEAHSLCLGTCWLGEILNKKEKINQLLKVPRDYELMAVVTLGYPTPKRRTSTRQPLKDFIYKTI